MTNYLVGVTTFLGLIILMIASGTGQFNSPKNNDEILLARRAKLVWAAKETLRKTINCKYIIVYKEVFKGNNWENLELKIKLNCHDDGITYKCKCSGSGCEEIKNGHL